MREERNSGESGLFILQVNSCFRMRHFLCAEKLTLSKEISFYSSGEIGRKLKHSSNHSVTDWEDTVSKVGRDREVSVTKWDERFLQSAAAVERLARCSKLQSGW